jgi:hypothetical protein
MSSSDEIRFGYPDFWPKVHEVYGPVFCSFTHLADLTGQMLLSADERIATPVENAIHFLTRLTAFGFNDALLLCGNGSGTGAMKIVRGMFETTTLAEYLRLNPAEVDDYIDFGRVLSWRRYQWMLARNPEAAKRFAPDKVIELEREYNLVKGRFANKKGVVRNQWTTKSLGKMAEEIGRTDQYELVYSLGSSMHHANFEGLTGYVEMKEGAVTMDGPPSLAWVGSSLIAAHTYLLFALDTLNQGCKLAFDEKLTAAGDKFQGLWKGRACC